MSVVCMAPAHADQGAAQTLQQVRQTMLQASPNSGQVLDPAISRHLSRDTQKVRYVGLPHKVGATAQAKTIQNTVNVRFPGNGWYWDPDQSGTGFMFEAQGNRAFVTFFVYSGTTGEPTWFAASGDFNATLEGYRFTGMLQYYSGGQPIDSPTYKQPTGSNVDTISINFVGNFASATLPFRDKVMRAQRFSFAGLDKPAVGNQGETGWFWDPNGAGRGIGFEVQNNQLFMAVFHYRADGTPTWHTTSTPISSNGTFSGALDYFAWGQALLEEPYYAPLYRGTVGNISGTFSDKCNMQLSLPGNNRATMTRLPLAAANSEQACVAKYGQIPTTNYDGGQFANLLGTFVYGSVTAQQNKEFRQALVLACASPSPSFINGKPADYYFKCREQLPRGYSALGLSHFMERGGMPRSVGKATVIGPMSAWTNYVYDVQNMPGLFQLSTCSMSRPTTTFRFFASSAFTGADVFTFNGLYGDTVVTTDGFTALYYVSKTSTEFMGVSPDAQRLATTFAPGQAYLYEKTLSSTTKAKMACESSNYRP